MPAVICPGLLMKKGKTTQRYGDHEELIRRLAVRHQPPEWVFIPNLRVGTGLPYGSNQGSSREREGGVSASSGLLTSGS